MTSVSVGVDGVDRPFFVSLVYIEPAARDVHFSPDIAKSCFYACIKFDFGYVLTYWPARPFAIRSRPDG
jgi:hypothetical protein